METNSDRVINSGRILQNGRRTRTVTRMRQPRIRTLKHLRGMRTSRGAPVTPGTNPVGGTVRPEVHSTFYISEVRRLAMADDRQTAAKVSKEKLEKDLEPAGPSGSTDKTVEREKKWEDEGGHPPDATQTQALPAAKPGLDRENRDQSQGGRPDVP
jgi:hypothetical protein